MSGVLKPFQNIKLYYLVTGCVNTWNKRYISKYYLSGDKWMEG